VQPQLNKKSIRRNFDRAADSYDASAVLQREVAARLLERLDYIRAVPKTILDVGAGTGFIGAGLRQRYKQSQIIELDLSVRMLQKIRNKSPWYKRLFNTPPLLCADAEQLPLKDNSVDMIFSSLAIQWVNDLQNTFAEFMRVLRPGGLVMFTTFGPDTLKELRQSWQQVDSHDHVNSFIDMHDIGDSMLACRFAEPVMDVENIVLTYESVSGLMQDLKDIGATNASEQRQRGLTSKSAYQAMTDAYESMRVDGKLPATYEVVYGHAWKAEAKETSAEVEVEFNGKDINLN